MDNVRDALMLMVKSARELKETIDGLDRIGFCADSLSDAHGNIVDAIYALIGEHTELFDESVTAKYLMRDNPLGDKEITELLMDEWQKNMFPTFQFKPVSREEFQEMVKKNGGYMCPTPEGDWT